MKKIEDLKVGDSFELKKRVGWVEVLLFALLTGDWGWVHTRPSFAKKAGFRGPIVHGLLVTGYLGKAVAKLIGHAAMVTEIKGLKFRQVPIGATITSKVTISRIDLRPSQRLVIVQCSCECVLPEGGVSRSRGEALVRVLDI